MQSEAEDPHATPGSRKNWAENVHRDPILGGKCIRHRDRGWDRGELLGIFGGVVPPSSQNPALHKKRPFSTPVIRPGA